MQRSSIIATVIAAGGILIAGSVASVAVINAASSSQPDSETIQLVVAGGTTTPSPESTESDTAGTEAVTATDLPSIDAAALPAIPEVSEAPTQQAAPAKQPAPAKSGANASTSTSSDDSATKASDSPSMLSAAQARSIVLKKGRGVSIVSTSRESREGYSTWAVRITRSNGEVLTGYVDRASGVVVDWTVNQKAQAAQPSPSASDDDDDSDDYEDDESDDSDEYEDDHSDEDDD